MKKDIVGIIGGIGPYAGVDLLSKILDNTIATTDTDHIPTILFSLPDSISDRNKYILEESPNNPADGIIEIMNTAKKCGVTIIAIACNAAHSDIIFSKIQKHAIETGLKLISIVDATINYLANNESNTLTSVFSVKGTHYSKVYEKSLKVKNITSHQISSENIDRIHEIIWNNDWGIKSQSAPVTDKARAELIAIINNLKTKGVNTIILACTELPLAIPETKINDISIIDPTLILARAIINSVSPKKLSSL